MSNDPFMSKAHFSFLPKPQIIFMNEYDTIKYPGDCVATPYKYLEKLEEIQSYPGSQGLLAGISE